MTCIAQFKVFDGLSERDHCTLISGWINEVEPEQIAYELQLSQFLVKAYYGVRDLMFYESECRGNNA